MFVPAEKYASAVPLPEQFLQHLHGLYSLWDFSITSTTLPIIQGFMVLWAVVALMLWLSLTSIIMLIGVEINALLMELKLLHPDKYTYSP